MTAKPEAYVICGTPRSGSTMLCRMLADSGVAGAPHSYFREVDIAEWAADWGVDRRLDLTSAAFDRAYLEAMRRAAAAGTGLVGLRIMYASLADAQKRIGRALGQDVDVAEGLQAVFGPVLYIHLSRGDKLGQAVSLARAEQSGLWHLNADGSVFEGRSTPPPLVYDGARIAALVEELAKDDAAWGAFFAVRGISPLRLTYESLTSAPQRELGRVFGALGLSPALAETLAVPTAKMADGLSAEWVARFQRDSG